VWRRKQVNEFLVGLFMLDPSAFGEGVSGGCTGSCCSLGAGRDSKNFNRPVGFTQRRPPGERLSTLLLSGGARRHLFSRTAALTGEAFHVVATMKIIWGESVHMPARLRPFSFARMCMLGDAFAGRGATGGVALPMSSSRGTVWPRTGCVSRN